MATENLRQNQNLRHQDRSTMVMLTKGQMSLVFLLSKGQTSLIMLNNSRIQKLRDTLRQFFHSFQDLRHRHQDWSVVMLNNGRIQKFLQFFQSFPNLCHRHQARSMVMLTKGQMSLVMLNNGQMFFPQNRTQELRLRNILRQLQSII